MLYLCAVCASRVDVRFLNAAGLGLKPPLTLCWLSPGMMMWWPAATSIVHVKSIGVISSLFFP